jgi:uncharacterized integral membrane protein
MDRTPDPSDARRQDDVPGTGPGGPARQVPDTGAPSASVEQADATQGPRGRGAAAETPRPRVDTDPRLDEHPKRGIAGTTWIALILGLLILILLLVFILQNNVPADFTYLGWTFSLPLGVAMLLAAIAGALIMALVGSVRLFKLGHRVRMLEKEREAIKRALS